MYVCVGGVAIYSFMHISDWNGGFVVSGKLFKLGCCAVVVVVKGASASSSHSRFG